MIEAEQKRREQGGAGEAMSPLDTLLTDTTDSNVPGTRLLEIHRVDKVKQATWSVP